MWNPDWEILEIETGSTLKYNFVNFLTYKFIHSSFEYVLVYLFNNAVITKRVSENNEFLFNNLFGVVLLILIVILQNAS